jgi:hypothetical protein
VHVVADDAPADATREVFKVSLANGVGVGVATGFDETELRRLIGVVSRC